MGKTSVVGRVGGSAEDGALSSTWMETEAFLVGSQRNSTVLRCRGCEQGSRIPTDKGISANSPHFTKWADIFASVVGGEVHSGKL